MKSHHNASGSMAEVRLERYARQIRGEPESGAPVDVFVAGAKPVGRVTGFLKSTAVFVATFATVGVAGYFGLVAMQPDMPRMADYSPPAQAAPQLNTAGRPHLHRLAITLDRESREHLAEASARISVGDMESICRMLNDAASEDLTKAALRDLARPWTVDQKNNPSCTAAAVQMKLAVEQPKLYVEVLTALVRNRNYRMAGGETLEPHDSRAADDRSVSSRVLQNAFMHHSIERHLNILRPGMRVAAATRLLNQLFGRSDITTQDRLPWQSGDHVYQHVEDEIARGRTALVGFKGHTVLAAGLDRSGPTPRVILYTWGQRKTVTVDEFILGVCEAGVVDDGVNDWRVTSR